MIYILLVFIVFLIDFLSKKLVKKYIKVGQCKTIIKNKLDFFHVENKGFAFNFMENKKYFINLSNFFSILFLSCIFFIKVVKNKDKSSPISKIFISIGLGGAFGNFFDRIKYSKVTDFIKFNIKKCPIFNLADFFLMLIPFSIILDNEKT